MSEARNRTVEIDDETWEFYRKRSGLGDPTSFIINAIDVMRGIIEHDDEKRLKGEATKPTEHEIEIDDDTWELARKLSGLDDPTPYIIGLLTKDMEENKASKPSKQESKPMDDEE